MFGYFDEVPGMVGFLGDFVLPQEPKKGKKHC